jgi:hypothetical protein
VGSSGRLRRRAAEAARERVHVADDEQAAGLDEAVERVEVDRRVGREADHAAVQHDVEGRSKGACSTKPTRASTSTPACAAFARAISIMPGLPSKTDERRAQARGLDADPARAAARVDDALAGQRARDERDEPAHPAVVAVGRRAGVAVPAGRVGVELGARLLLAHRVGAPPGEQRGEGPSPAAPGSVSAPVSVWRRTAAARTAAIHRADVQRRPERVAQRGELLVARAAGQQHERRPAGGRAHRAGLPRRGRGEPDDERLDRQVGQDRVERGRRERLQAAV